jgi:hypothetical protein
MARRNSFLSGVEEWRLVAAGASPACPQRLEPQQHVPAAVRFPELPRPRCPVTIVCGPPGAGKSTYVEERAEADDVIIDLDDCFIEVCGVHGHIASRQHLVAAMQVRNRRLAAALEGDSKLWFIVGAPSDQERAQWQQRLGAELVALDTDAAVCRARLGGQLERLEGLEYYLERRRKSRVRHLRPGDRRTRWHDPDRND